MSKKREDTVNLIPFSEVCELGGGYGFPRLLQTGTGGEIPFIKVSDMSLPENEKYIVTANNFVKSEVAKSKGWTAFPKGSVVFAKVGAALKLNRRRILTRPTLIDNNMMAAIPTEKLYSKFLFHFLCSVDFSDFVQDGVVPSVNQRQVGSIRIPNISVDKQRRIAEILDTADSAIQQTEQLIAKLKQVKAGLLHDLLTRGVDAGGALRDPDAHPEQFKVVEGYGRVPREWEVKPLGTHASLLTGFAFRSSDFQEDGIQLLKMGNLYQARLDLTRDTVFLPEYFLDEHKRYLLHPGDIVMSMTGTLGKEDYGFAVLLPENSPKLFLNQRVAKVIPDESLKQKFLFYQLQSRVYLNQLYKLPGGTKQANLSVSEILSVSFMYPDISEQERISNILNAHDERIHAEEAYRDKLHQIKRGLMQDLLTGRVRV